MNDLSIRIISYKFLCRWNKKLMWKHQYSTRLDQIILSWYCYEKRRDILQYLLCFLELSHSLLSRSKDPISGATAMKSIPRLLQSFQLKHDLLCLLMAMHSVAGWIVVSWYSAHNLNYMIWYVIKYLKSVVTLYWE